MAFGLTNTPVKGNTGSTFLINIIFIYYIFLRQPKRFPAQHPDIIIFCPASVCGRNGRLYFGYGFYNGNCPKTELGDSL